MTPGWEAGLTALFMEEQAETKERKARQAVAGLRALQAEIRARTRCQKLLRYAEVKAAIESGRSSAKTK